MGWFILAQFVSTLIAMVRLGCLSPCFCAKRDGFYFLVQKEGISIR
jgi:hypothetical protein